MLKNKKFYINRNLALIFIAAFIGITSFFHYSIPAKEINTHFIHFRLNYIPIIIGAVFFGLKGGISVSLIISFIFIIPFLKHQVPLSTSSNILEFVMYIIVGSITGYLVEKVNKQKEMIKENEIFIEMGRFSGIVAHEIKNPIQSLKTVYDILKKKITNQENQQFLDILKQEINRLNNLVENFLNFTKPLKLKKIKVYLKDFFNKIIEEIKFQYPDTEIELEIDKEDLEYEFDYQLFRMVIINIIKNAIEAIDKSDVIVIKANQTKKLEINISNTGSQIKEEDIKNIFKPFYTTKSQGTGLGLSLCKKIVEAHNGKIQAQNTKNKKGVNFKIIL